MKKNTNYSYQAWLFAAIAIVILGGIGVFAAKKLVWRSAEPISAKFDRIIGASVTTLESDEVQAKIDDLAMTFAKTANLADDDKQLLKNMIQAMIIKLEDPCLFEMVAACSKDANERIAKILNIDPAVIAEFDKKEQALSDKRMRGEMIEASFIALMDQLESEPQYMPIARLRKALKDSEQLDKQWKKDPRVQKFYKKLQPKIFEALSKALQ